MINEMIATLREALEYVRSSGDTSMFSVCIQSLQAIINAFGKCAEDIKDSSVIENLNRLIKILSDNTPDIDMAVAAAKKLSDDCRCGLAYKIKVLFVAELGGKWDAMKSVYDECTRREDIQTDIVLQPVFREVKQPDGSIRHEEANADWLTPMGIKHTPYKEYDMKTERPDITFFSQPYEGCTDPMFWPENMSKYTRVVYVPYYTAITMHSSSPTYYSFMKSPTQMYSWKIICQSDVMKKYYRAESYHRGANVVVTGLPKWDHPMRIEKEKIKALKEWNNKLDGKTVFLWNTHFTAEISGSQIFTPKGIEFLKIFMNDPKIALIWRPHPMMETVISMYFPKEKKELYSEIKHIFAVSENMVIDKHEYYDASFAYSDAMISDRSSLVDQYLFMKKPILILTNQSIEDEKAYLCNDPELCDHSDIAFANTIDMQKEFIYDVAEGKDKYIKAQSGIIKKYFPLADGHCGERVVEVLINELKEEK